MTSAITPDPAIHNVPAVDSGQFTVQDAQQLIAWGEQLLRLIEQAIAHALLNVTVLGVQPFVALQQFGEEVLGGATDVGSLISGIGGNAITDVVNLLLKIQQIIDHIVQTLNPSLGTGNPVTSLVTNLEGSLGGLFGKIFSNGDGTATAVDGVTSNGDGTATVVPSLGDLSGYSLFENLDGTAMSVIELLQNVAGAAGSLGGNLTKSVGNVQLIIDNVANAVGLGGSGHSVSTVLAALEDFPYENVTSILGSAHLGADVQAIVDQLANAFGHSGTGHTLANLLSYAEAIPNTVVTDVLGGANLGADVQAIVDKVVNAMGVSGTGHTLATLLSSLEAIPGDVVTGITSGNSITTDVQDVVNSVYNAVENVTTGVNQAVTTVESGLGSFFSGLFNSFTGGGAATASASQAVTAALGVYATTATNNLNIGGLTGLSVASLNHALQLSSIGTGGSNSGGLYETINISGYATQSVITAAQPTGPGFTLSSGIYSGSNNPTLGVSALNNIGVVNGGGAHWLSNSIGYEFAYFPTVTTTDYQIVSMNLGALGGSGPTLLAGRSDSTMSTFVGAFLWGGQLFLGCYVSGVWTQFDVVLHTAISGALYELVLGSAATSSLYTIEVLCNGSALISLTDTSHISQVGSSFRYGGLGMTQPFSGSQYGPTADIAVWGIADNAPPATIGSGFRAYASSNHSVSAGAIPGTAFDTVQYQTGDFTYNATTGVLTVGVTGHYLFSGRIVASGANIIGLDHNGSQVALGIYDSSETASALSTPVYCVAGDTVQPTISTSVTMDAGTVGASTFWTFALMNCGTLS
jgi:hypothetical protein